MERIADTPRQETAAPKTEAYFPRRDRDGVVSASLIPALQAIHGGVPAQVLPPATLTELAKILGNSAMEALLALEVPGPDLTWPNLDPPRDGPAQEIDPGAPALTRPPELAGLSPPAGLPGDPAALRGAEVAAWPTPEGGDAV